MVEDSKGPPVVGVTGGIGSGKTAVTDALQDLGITVVDADQASRVIMEPGRPALEAVHSHFGDGVMLPDGTLDRAALRKIVFADTSQRQWLEQLTHPLIAAEIRAALAAATSAYVVLASPLLLETSQKDYCDLVVVVDVPETVQLERTIRRDGNDEAQVRRIMAAQCDRERRLAAADEIVDNSGTLAELKDKVLALHQRLLQRFGREDS